MTMSRMNMRPQGQPDAPGYSPHRDLAYVYPELMRTAFVLLDECNWTPEFCERMQELGITENDLAEGVEAFVKALDSFIRDPGIASPADAFRGAGFAAIKVDVQRVLFEKFGEVLTGGWFVAVRDVTLRGKLSDAATQMSAMLAAGTLTAVSLRDPATGDDALFEELHGKYFQYSDAIEATHMRDAAIKAMKQAQEDLADIRSKLNEKEAQLNFTTSDLAWMRAEYDAVRARELIIIATVQLWTTAKLIPRLCTGVKLFMKVLLKRKIFDA